FGDSQFTSTLSVNFHFPKIPRRTFFCGCGGRETKKDRVRDPVKEPAHSGKKCGRSGLVAGPGIGP
ncbi:hypothetical protein, partial [Aeromonas sp. QDB14]|uniref:hypothetical protein n=1 Tax=Aeromonas sp. QDB14 TaxID=2989836 RepID=UPI0022E4EB77